MQQIMRDADELAVLFGNERMQRLDRIEETPSRRIRHFRRER